MDEKIIELRDKIKNEIINPKEKEKSLKELINTISESITDAFNEGFKNGYEIKIENINNLIDQIIYDIKHECFTSALVHLQELQQQYQFKQKERK